jgi:hypothetical protein
MKKQKKEIFGQTHVNAYLKSGFRSREGFCRVFETNGIVPKRRTELPLSLLKKQRGYFIYY